MYTSVPNTETSISKFIPYKETGHIRYIHYNKGYSFNINLLNNYKLFINNY